MSRMHGIIKKQFGGYPSIQSCTDEDLNEFWVELEYRLDLYSRLLSRDDIDAEEERVLLAEQAAIQRDMNEVDDEWTRREWLWREQDPALSIF